MRNHARRVPFAGGLTIILFACGGIMSAGAGEQGAPGTPALDLRALVEEAGAANPRILAAQARLEASGHLAPQVEALPDPMASVSYTNDSISDVTLGDSVMSNLRLTWTQEVPYPGKRRLAGDVARAAVGVTAGQLEAVRLEVFAAVKTAYVDLHRIDRTRQIVEENRGMLEAMKEAARARYENGQAILENVLRAQTELTRVEADLARLDQERATVAAGLDALLGRKPGIPPGPALAPPTGLIPEPAAAESAALERSPGLETLRRRVNVEEARLALAKKSLKPDFLWSAAYIYRADIDPMVMGAFGIRLPLYRDRKQSQQIAQTGIELEASRQDEADGAAALVSRVSDLIARARRAELVSRLYSEGVIPQSRSARDASLAAYSGGQTEFITVITDHLATLRDEIEYENQRADMFRALAALEPLTGLDLVAAGEEAP